MSRLVIEIAQNAGSGRKRHFTIDRFPARVGRGYHNQVIVDDPYVSPQHLEITYSETEGHMVEDLGSMNGLSLNGKKLERARTRIYSGDKLQIGKTVVRVYEPQHSVPPAMPMMPETGFLHSLASPSLSLPLFVLALIVLAGWMHFNSAPTKAAEIEATQVISVAMAGGLIGIVWSGLWGLVGRLARHRVNFMPHLGVFSAYLIVLVGIYYVSSYVTYLLNGNLIASAFNYAATYVPLALFLATVLGLAVDMPRRRLRVVAIVVTLALFAGTGALQWFENSRFSLRPEYNAELQPYLTVLAPTETVESLSARAGDLFNAHDFAR